MWISFYRVPAAVPSSIEGTMLVLPLELTDGTRNALADVAQRWRSHPDSDLDFGDLRRATDRYDFVALQPRGVGTTQLPCEPMDGDLAANALITGDAEAWRTWERDVRMFIGACGDNARHVSTRNHVADLDVLREALGAPTWHIYARGHGGWVASWYASLHSTRTGRLLLDNSLGFGSDAWPAQSAGSSMYAESILWSGPVRDVVSHPSRFRLGTSPNTVMKRLRGMPVALRHRWWDRLITGDDIAAALAIAEAWPPTARPSLASIKAYVAAYRFHPDASIDESLHVTALRLLNDMVDGGPSSSKKYALDGATMATACNDVAWHETANELMEKHRFELGVFALPNPTRSIHGIACQAWPYAASGRPGSGPLHRISPFLMVHAAVHYAAPVDTAIRVTRTFDTARLVVQQNASSTFVVADDRARCASRMAGHYLLTGDVPSASVTRCNDGPARSIP